MTLSSFRSIESFYIENLGCAKNQVDAERIIALLTSRGLRYERDDPSHADLIIVNTCAFIQPAREEAIQTLLGFRREWPGKKILAAGCLPQRYRDELADELSEVDGFSGNDNLQEVLAAVLDLDQGIPARRWSAEEKEPWDRSVLLNFPGSVYVKISEGCRNRCTYCSIPLIRGDLASRGRDEVVREIVQLRQKGLFEFNLIAQDLANFGLDRGKPEFVRLLRDLSDQPGDFWLRLLYIHPDHFPKEIIPLIKEDPRILPYFDLPFQHASPGILKAMNRSGSPELYLDLLAEIRESLPEAVIRSTFLTGFPGETSQDLDRLLDFQQRAQLTWLGVFAYSREEGTPAAAMSRRPGRREADRRKALLEERQIPLTELALRRFIGKESVVLIEEPVAGGDMAIGRSWLQAPEVDGLTVIRGGYPVAGKRLRARIISLNGVDLEAVPL